MENNNDNKNTSTTESTLDSLYPILKVKLEKLSPTNPIQDFRLKKGENTIGRAPTNDVCLRGEVNTSKFHASIDFDGERLFLTDLNSANKTQMLLKPGSDRVELIPFQKYQIFHATKIVFGATLSQVQYIYNNSNSNSTSTIPNTTTNITPPPEPLPTTNNIGSVPASTTEITPSEVSSSNTNTALPSEPSTTNITTSPPETSTTTHTIPPPEPTETQVEQQQQQQHINKPTTIDENKTEKIVVPTTTTTETTMGNNASSSTTTITETTNLDLNNDIDKGRITDTTMTTTTTNPDNHPPSLNPAKSLSPKLSTEVPKTTATTTITAIISPHGLENTKDQQNKSGNTDVEEVKNNNPEIEISKEQSKSDDTVIKDKGDLDDDEDEIMKPIKNKQKRGKEKEKEEEDDEDEIQKPIKNKQKRGKEKEKEGVDDEDELEKSDFEKEREEEEKVTKKRKTSAASSKSTKVSNVYIKVAEFDPISTTKTKNSESKNNNNSDGDTSSNNSSSVSQDTPSKRLRNAPKLQDDPLLVDMEKTLKSRRNTKPPEKLLDSMKTTVTSSPAKKSTKSKSSTNTVDSSPTKSISTTTEDSTLGKKTPTKSKSTTTSIPLTTEKSEEQKPKILFSLISEKMVKDFNKIINKLGGEMAENPKDCTHLICDELKRSKKILECITLGRIIVSSNWLTDSKTAGEYLKEDLYFLQDKKAENEWSFNLEKSLSVSRTRTQKLFHNLNFYITGNCLPPKEFLLDIILDGGGNVLDNLPVSLNSDLSGQYFVLGSEKDRKTSLKKWADMGISVFKGEIILLSVLRQSFDVNSEECLVLTS
eukprot:gene4003-5006_t